MMIQCMITMIHKMDHHIHTTFGDSKISASRATWQALIAGIGQGNGAGPQIWAAVSSPILDIMQRDGFYAHLIMAISHIKNWLALLSLMIQIYAFLARTSTKKTFKVRCNIQWTSGKGYYMQWEGHWSPPNVFGTSLIFDLSTTSKWTYITKSQHPGELAINNKNNNQVTIPRLETNEARHTLGVPLHLMATGKRNYNISSR